MSNAYRWDGPHRRVRLRIRPHGAEGRRYLVESLPVRSHPSTSYSSYAGRQDYYGDDWTAACVAVRRCASDAELPQEPPRD